MPAGYSGTPLYRKLGVRPGSTLSARHAPAHYKSLLEGLPEDVKWVKGKADLVHFFVQQREVLEAALPSLMADIPKNGTIWISWPKKSSGVATDVTEDVIRAAALALGLVDVKVCAVDEVWSGLKLVYRLANR
ncbi:DUF3052 family protein [Chitinophaga lutea]|uniref:DUF3052 family protein n=1 Tax=Chitinophaga lutea TaxID=2488634 RepID=A0A3N4Q7Q2_9BACT|nr:DUF3052 family protein [Chitinophaga lutea]RPE13581.1 DUF3052 family protein [Chitinophaga lutea]